MKEKIIKELKSADKQYRIGKKHLIRGKTQMEKIIIG